jgi:hypothetical protein
VAYDSTQIRMAAQFGIDQGHLWIYNSPDAHATTEGANYFANGGTIGMKVNDIVIVVEQAGGGATLHSVTNVVAPVGGLAAPGAASISPGQFA